MTKHPITAHLLTFALIFGGLAVSFQVKKEIYPEFEIGLVQVSVDYPGVSPKLIQEGILLAIEEQVESLEGVKNFESFAFEGRGIVTIELIRGFDANKFQQDLKTKIDAILSFPKDAEKPIVTALSNRKHVVSVILYGNQDRRTLKFLADKVKDDLKEIPGVDYAEITLVSPLQVTVEVPSNILRAYNLTLGKIAETIKNTSLDLPGGGVKNSKGEVLLRIEEKRNQSNEFENIPIFTNLDGTVVYLGEIAEIQETFEISEREASFNGFPALRINVFRGGEGDPFKISKEIKRYVSNLKEQLPATTSVSIWNDRTEAFKIQSEILIKNGISGLLLVILFLGLFLEPKVAFWVALGIPTSLLGSFLLMPFFGASINMISLFAFILTLGIIVDDAILVGENIYQKRTEWLSPLASAIQGAQEVKWSVAFCVLTNIIAFTPLLFIPGTNGKFVYQIPAIAIAVFT